MKISKIEEYDKDNLLLTTKDGLYILKKPKNWDKDLNELWKVHFLVNKNRSVMLKKLINNPWIGPVLLIVACWIPALLIDSLNGVYGHLDDLSDHIAIILYSAPFVVAAGYIVNQIIKEK